jgi:hypothetical protein
MITKRLNNINAFACKDNEVYYQGTDENGKDFMIVFTATDLLEWLDVSEIKQQTLKYIQEL